MIKFNRRHALIAAAMVGLTAVMPGLADARTMNFSVPTYNKLIESGKPFLVSVHTSWCSTCAAQKRVLGSLRSKGDPYSGLTELTMDWDKYRGSKIGKQLRIPRRSTLIMFDGGKESGRIIAGTSAGSIKQLLDKDLN